MTSAKTAWSDFLLFVGYTAISFGWFGRALIEGLSARYIGRSADPSMFMWFLAYWPYALRHHANLLSTDLLWAPVGFNLAWATCVPLAGILATPLTQTLGVVPTYNLLMLLGPPLAAVSAFALCRRVSGAFWPAALGGFVFGFSPFMTGQMLSHLHLVLIFPLPLAAYLAVRRLEESLGKRLYVILLGLVVAGEILLSLEVFALMTMMAGLLLVLGLLQTHGDARRRILGLGTLTLAGWALGAAATLPYLYQVLAHGMPSHPIWPSERFSVDLLNLLIPSSVSLFGANRWVEVVNSRFSATVMEQCGYIALPLLAVATVWTRRHWEEALTRVLVCASVLAVILALGPLLQIAGRPMLPLPWLALCRLPLLEHALPDRMMMFAFMVLALIAALWTADPRTASTTRLTAAILIVVLMLPNPRAAFWARPVKTPDFFTNGTCRQSLSLADVVLTLPWGDTGNAMLWQARCEMGFRNAGGWTGIARFQVRRWPIVNFFLGARDVPQPEFQFKSFLAATGVTAIVIDQADPRAARWEALASTLGLPAKKLYGVSLYRIPPGALARYRKVSALAAEERANCARFETLLEAADRYLRHGNPLNQISVGRLAKMGLIPQKWTPQPGDYFDMWIGPVKRGEVAIAEQGSLPGLRKLIDTYQGRSQRIYFPFPRLLSQDRNASALRRIAYNLLTPPAANPTDGESLQFLAVVFNRAQIRDAAARLRKSQTQSKPAVVRDEPSNHTAR